MFATVALITVGAASVLPARGARWTVGVAGVLDAVAAVSYLGATHTGYLSVVAVLSSLYPGVTVLLARTLAQERLVRRQLAGLGCAGVAVALFALG
jgi:drug/metabolite transporter (DMT)-like permease